MHLWLESVFFFSFIFTFWSLHRVASVVALLLFCLIVLFCFRPVRSVRLFISLFCSGLTTEILLLNIWWYRYCPIQVNRRSGGGLWRQKQAQQERVASCACLSVTSSLIFFCFSPFSLPRSLGNKAVNIPWRGSSWCCRCHRVGAMFITSSFSLMSFFPFRFQHSLLLLFWTCVLLDSHSVNPIALSAKHRRYSFDSTLERNLRTQVWTTAAFAFFFFSREGVATQSLY